MLTDLFFFAFALLDETFLRSLLGVVMGMSGLGILPISYLNLANVSQVSGWKLPISGNGGVTHHSHAANFLALGCQNVQLCTYPTVEGLGVITHLTEGLSHLLAQRGIKNVKELVGCALPDPIRDFMDMPGKKRMSSCSVSLCIKCGNCVRCPYDAISLDRDTGYPVVNASKCIGCGFCVLQCPAKALAMRERTYDETAAMELEHGKQTA